MDRARTQPLLLSNKRSRQWSTTFDSVSDMVCLLATDGTVLRCNRAMGAFLALEEHEIVGKKCFELMHSSRTFFKDCPYPEMLSTGMRESSELSVGDSWYEVTADPLVDTAGEIVGAVHIVRDTTARRRAEDALAEKSLWLAAINALSVDLASLPREADLGRFLAGRLRQLTAATAVAFSEYLPEERVLATRVIELGPGGIKRLTAPLIRRLEGTRSPVSDETYREIMSNENTLRATLTEASFGAIPPSVDAAVRRVLGVARYVGLAYVMEDKLFGTSVLALSADTPDPPPELLDAYSSLAAVSLRRRRAEGELQAKTKELDSLFALSGDMLGIADSKGIIRRANPAGSSTLGYPLAEIEGHPIAEFLHPDDLERTLAAVADIAAGRPVAGFTNRHRHRDGSYRLIEWHVTPQDGGLLVAVGRDITDRAAAQELEEVRRRQEEDVLRRAGAYNRSLIEASLDPLVTIGPDGLITDVNEATVAVTGARARNSSAPTSPTTSRSPRRHGPATSRSSGRGGTRLSAGDQASRRPCDRRALQRLHVSRRGRDVRRVRGGARHRRAKRAEAEICSLNASLEQRVQERTREARRGERGAARVRLLRVPRPAHAPARHRRLQPHACWRTTATSSTSRGAATSSACARPRSAWAS